MMLPNPEPTQFSAYTPQLQSVLDTFKRYLYLEDTGHIELGMATVLANRGPGDPVWMVIIGPPGGGKTEPLNAIAALSDVFATATLTMGGLLSGTSRKERSAEAKGGLLNQIGEYGIIAVKDFSSILSMSGDQRAMLMAAMREVYDGSWVRHLGTDGGIELTWQGKCGLIGAATPSLDAAYSVVAEMGERYSYYRMPVANDAVMSMRAALMSGGEPEIRATLSKAVIHFFDKLSTPTLGELNETELNKLVALATLTVKARSQIGREATGDRDIFLVPDPEVPTRFVKVLRLLYNALLCLGVRRPRAWDLIEKVAQDSMPKLRHDVLMLVERWWEMPLTDLEEELTFSRTTIRRCLEELACFGLVRIKGGHKRNGVTTVWEATELLHRLYDQGMSRDGLY